MVCSLQEVDTGLRTKEALDATWMDDATFLVVADTAADLPGAMAITGKAVLDACVSRTPLPNLDRGKTELIAHVVGAGSRGLRKDLFSLPDASLAIPRKLWDGAHIRLVPTYQHLGGFIHHDASLVRELRHRVGAAWKAFNARKKRVFSSPTVSLQDKAILYESLILSILLHGPGHGEPSAQLSSPSWNRPTLGWLSLWCGLYTHMRRPCTWAAAMYFPSCDFPLLIRCCI